MYLRDNVKNYFCIGGVVFPHRAENRMATRVRSNLCDGFLLSMGGASTWIMVCFSCAHLYIVPLKLLTGM